ncbi:MAG: NAD(P)H-hydrate dehydratase [Chloracidobacterium sp.]|nr:NAD(P)H-hydrate dehydratase [Chloracidobacterium sp.]
MQKVLTAAQMREVDRLTTEKYGIPSILLMENAAHAVARVITEKLGGSVEGRRILILCGKGNNGGDGAALARILWNQGASCFVDLIGSVSETTGDARINFDAVKAIDESPDTNGPNENCLLINEISEDNRETFFYNWRSQHICVFVDALFGTGLTRPLEGSFKKIAEAVSRAKERHLFEKVIAIDMPSGLDADCKINGSICANVDVTVTFTSPKPANILPPASNFNGELMIANIGSPMELIDEQPSNLYLAEREDSANWLKEATFSTSDYKNTRGHSLIIAGSESYSGAAVLAGNAAMRSGVGLVTVVTSKSSKDLVASRILPEVMVRGVAETDGGAISEEAFNEIGELWSKADSVAIGCGLSQDESTRLFVKKVVEDRRQPTIVDADALNLLSPFDGFAANGESQCPLILTPHEGEFMRLLGTTDKEAIKDRVAAVRDFAVKHNVILVLKGERVLIGEPGGKVVVNPTGNSGLGKAGNGDTLAGILAGFVAQASVMNIDIFETVVAAVYVAGMAGDVAEKKYGKRVMTASDVRECLSEVFEGFKNER